LGPQRKNVGKFALGVGEMPGKEDKEVDALKRNVCDDTLGLWE
jgi:hypothetical protein